MDSVLIKACTEKWCGKAYRMYKLLAPRAALAFFILRDLCQRTKKGLSKLEREDCIALCAGALSASALTVSVFVKSLRKLRGLFLAVTLMSTIIVLYRMFRNKK